MQTRQMLLLLVLVASRALGANEPEFPTRPPSSTLNSATSNYRVAWEWCLWARERIAALETSMPVGPTPSPNIEERLDEILEALQQREQFMQLSLRFINSDQMEGLGDRMGDLHYVGRLRPAEQGLWDNLDGGEFIDVSNPLLPPAPFLLHGFQVQTSGLVVHLEWIDRSENETGFSVYRAASGSDGTYTWSKLVDVPANQTEVDLAAEVGTHVYTVRSFNTLGHSADAVSKIVIVQSVLAQSPAPEAITLLATDFTAALDLANGSDSATDRPDILDLTSEGRNFDGKVIGYFARGEWVEWAFETKTNTDWRLEVWMANPTEGGEVEISIDGGRFENISVSKSAQWYIFLPISRTISLSPARHVIRVSGTKAAENGWIGDIAQIRLLPELQ